VYSRDTIKPSTQGNDQVTVPSRLHLPSIPGTLQRRAIEVNTTCGGDDDNSATIITIIHTPWPIVAGQAILSIIIALRSPWYGALDPRTGLPTHPSRFKQALWAIGLVRAVGALVFQVMDIAESNAIIPSVGTSITFGSLLSGSFQFNAGIGARILSYLGISIASLGLLLYTINGTLAWVLHNDANVSAILVFGDQVVYYWTMGDWLARISWIAGAFFFFLIILSPIFPLFCCYRPRWKYNENTRATYFRRTAMATSFVIAVGGIAAIVSAGMNAGGGPIESESMICGDFSLPGSVSGFWDVWTQDKVAVVRSLFTW
jgi:hypothetical protein